MQNKDEMNGVDNLTGFHKRNGNKSHPGMQLTRITSLGVIQDVWNKSSMVFNKDVLVVYITQHTDSTILHPGFYQHFANSTVVAEE